MRTMFYWLLILFFFISGSSLIINKDANRPYEIPYLSGEAFNFGSISYGSLISEADIVSVEEWEDILIGEWSYRFIEPYGRNTYLIEGEAEFKSDGTFFKYITWKMYDTKFSYEQDDPKIIAGGSYSGTWSMENEVWREEILKCLISKTQNHLITDLDICETFYNRSERKVFGNFNDEKSKSKVIYFNNRNITLESKSFATGETSTYVFQRIGEAPKKIKNKKKQASNYERNKPEPFLYSAYIQDSDGFTYVRNRPSLQGVIIDTVFLGEKFKVINDESKWRLIKTPKGITGYMHYSRIKKID